MCFNKSVLTQNGLFRCALHSAKLSSADEERVTGVQGDAETCGGGASRVNKRIGSAARASALEPHTCWPTKAAGRRRASRAAQCCRCLWRGARSASLEAPRVSGCAPCGGRAPWPRTCCARTAFRVRTITRFCLRRRRRAKVPSAGTEAGRGDAVAGRGVFGVWLARLVGGRAGCGYSHG